MVRTQVGIIGAGPAGLVLCRLLRLHGIEAVILESRSLEYVEGRVRAGVIDSDVSELFRVIGVGERMDREGLFQEQMEMRFSGKRRYINWHQLAGGRRTVIYGQQEVVKDFLKKHREDSQPIYFEAEALRIEGLEDDRPVIHYRHEGEEKRLECDLVAACDGFHGIGRKSIPPQRIKQYEHRYPFAWLGILANAKPSSRWLVTSAHDRGYAMHSMRSGEVSRNYVQIGLDDTLEEWPDERVWEELRVRLGANADWPLAEGPIAEKVKLDLRSFVCEPMQYRRLFLAGDAAHVVPPTGGRGMNQAVADVCVLADAMAAFYRTGGTEELGQYSGHCLSRVWHAQQFSWRLTSMLQRHDFTDEYHRKQQLAQIEYFTSNRAAATSLAECYAGARLRTSFLNNADGKDYPRIV